VLQVPLAVLGTEIGEWCHFVSFQEVIRIEDNSKPFYVSIAVYSRKCNDKLDPGRTEVQRISTTDTTSKLPLVF
jgi:hypothetical protein